jgi:hypothetical protein
VIRDMSLASKLAYEDPALIMHICQTWGMETNASLIFGFKDLRAFIMHDKDNIVLCFRGTEIINPKDWSTDVKLKFVPMNPRASSGAEPASLPDDASRIQSKMAHFGFYNALGLTSTYEGKSPYSILYDTLQQLHHVNPYRKIWFTGHSLGGALASVFVGQLLLDNDHLIDHIGGLYTFGQPRSGNDEYGKMFDGLIKDELVFRTVNRSDLICKLPMKVTKYAHHGGKVILSRHKLSMPCKGQMVDRLPTITLQALPPNSNLKKIMFALIPSVLEDHYPSEYCRFLQFFV